MNTYFNYSSISVGEYLRMFYLFDDVSKKIFGFSIYMWSKKLLFLTCDTYKEKENIYSTNSWISNKRMKKICPTYFINSLFLDVSTLDCSSMYPTEVPCYFKGKIGLKLKKGYFIPQSEFIFENILRELIENKESNNVKGSILENEIKLLLSNFFGKDKVFQENYDSFGNEQDIFVVNEDYVISVERKARDFKEVLIDKKRTRIRLNQRFKRVVLEGCKQCERAKKHILTNESTIYYDSDKLTSVKFALKERPKKIIKIVVTLDDYLNLSESAHEYLNNNYIDTWILNIFDLMKILWATENSKKFVEYAEYRSSGIKSTTSGNNNELDQYGFFISKNYNFIPPNDIGIFVNLGGSFSAVFDEYDRLSFENELKGLENYLSEL